MILEKPVKLKTDTLLDDGATIDLQLTTPSCGT